MNQPIGIIGKRSKSKMQLIDNVNTTVTVSIPLVEEISKTENCSKMSFSDKIV